MRALIIALLFAASAIQAKAEVAAGRLVGLVELPQVKDAVSPAQLAQIQAAVAAYEKRRGITVPHPDLVEGAEGPFLFPFFPQAGILGKDLFLNNFTDQDPLAGLIRDWDCSDYTYDGHRGHDSLIRTFREQAVGVPVFAVRDGIVVAAHDGEPDMNVEWVAGTEANFVVLDHGDGYTARYLHLRKGSVAVSPGQPVTAGTQIGLTGSSGFSNWPHLHFETHRDGVWFEPSAGPCRSGDSFWSAQPSVVRDLYVADFLLSPNPILAPDLLTYLLDEGVRTGTFVKGSRTVHLRADLRNLPPRASFRVWVVNPRGKLVGEISNAFSNPGVLHIALGLFAFDLDLDQPGTWRLRAEINGGLAVDAPFRVVNNANQAKNRPPKKVTARLSPGKPVEGQVLLCAIVTSLVTEDPDYDLVSYRYEWKVNGRVVRSVTSAALSDLLPAGAASGNDKVSCRVIPNDGKKNGPASTAGKSIEWP